MRAILEEREGSVECLVVKNLFRRVSSTERMRSGRISCRYQFQSLGWTKAKSGRGQASDSQVFRPKSGSCLAWPSPELEGAPSCFVGAALLRLGCGSAVALPWLKFDFTCSFSHMALD